MEPLEPAIEAIGRYRLLRKLGEGGMGIVYAAQDPQLDRTVAVKMIRAAADAVARERFWREARAAASVNHPNICQLYEVGEAEGTLFIAMELLEGEPLSARIGRGPVPVPEAAQIALGMLAALDALHRRGLVHRDLKPSNIFLTPVGVKLLDFGLARPIARAAEDTAAALTVAGVVLGTPHYLAPEQALGEQVDARADLFAAGAVLFEMLAGKPPFAGSSVMQVVHAVVYENPPVLRGSPAVAALDRISSRALAKKPAQRYQSAAAMADDLRAAMLLADSGEMGRARPVTRLIVLPLRILRPDPETEFLAYSLPDAITSSLSGLESLVVRSSLTATQYAAPQLDLQAIARQADVDIVLTGTLLRAGEHVRVTTQLVEAPGGAVLWSHTAQVSLGDIFQLQDDLATRIVESLSVPLSARDERLLRHDVPASAKAYEFYLRANQLADDARNWTIARDLYEQCVAEDPTFAPAWARLGRMYRVVAAYGEDSAEEGYAKADAAFRRALTLNPELPLAHNLYTYLEVEMGAAEQAMLRLLNRARGSGDPELFAGLVQACRYCGLLEASVAAYQEARRLDPSIRTSVAHAYLMLGDYDRAVETCLESPPYISVLALELAGRTDEAMALLKKHEGRPMPHVFRAILASTRALIEGDVSESARLGEELHAEWHPRDPCAAYYMARHLARLGHEARALEWLGRTVNGGFFPFSFLTRDPWLDSVRHHPALRAILRQAETKYRSALAAFLNAGGDQVVGMAASR